MSFHAQFVLSFTLLLHHPEIPVLCFCQFVILFVNNSIFLCVLFRMFNANLLEMATEPVNAILNMVQVLFSICTACI